LVASCFGSNSPQSDSTSAGTTSQLDLEISRKIPKGFQKEQNGHHKPNKFNSRYSRYSSLVSSFKKYLEYFLVDFQRFWGLGCYAASGDFSSTPSQGIQRRVETWHQATMATMATMATYSSKKNGPKKMTL